MRNDKKIRERSFKFAIEIIRLTKEIPKDTIGFVLGRQLIKAGTSIGANVEDASGAYSKDDFTYKMSIALKEARETNYWLRLLKSSKIIRSSSIEEILGESENLRNILSAIVKTSKERREESLNVE